MMLYISCVGVFILAFYCSLTFITVFYHRAFAHKAVIIDPRYERLIAFLCTWVTGVDLKTWVCMHRLHHLYSDTPQDPHSPVHNSFVVGMLHSMHFSFIASMKGLKNHDETYTSVVSDFKFSRSWVTKNEVMIFIPAILHILVAILLASALNSWLLGLSYWLGIMSHPFQGWLVNSVGHKYGYRTFQLADNSHNNTWVGLFVAGEGYQNNHHKFPESAKFSVRSGEYDMGYILCKLMEKLGILQIHYRCTTVL